MDRNLILLNEVLLGTIRQAVREEIQSLLDGGLGEMARSVPDQEGEVGGPYLTVKEAAELSRVATSTLRLYIRKGKLPVRRVGRRVIVKRADLEAFLAAETETQGVRSDAGI